MNSNKTSVSAPRHLSWKTEAESDQQQPSAAATTFISSVFHHLQRERAHPREALHPQGLGRSLRRFHEE